MPESVLRGVLISDFNISNLCGFLANDSEMPAADAAVAPFGQPLQVMLDADHEIWRGHPHFAVVWTRPEGVIESFQRLAGNQPQSVDVILQEVDVYASHLASVADRVDTVFVPLWTPSTPRRGLGMLDMRPGLGLTGLLLQMNLRLAERCAGRPSIYLLDAQRWLVRAGRSAFNPTLWYMAKVPFGPEVFKEASRDIKSALRGLAGKARKLLILDLDETLWGGIVGELGWSHLNLGGHDPIGEAYADFQRELKALRRRGILLALVSKNDEEVALEAIRCHPEMALRAEDFAGWRINWEDKAQNIVDLVADLNLGLDSVVFIDDHPTERARVRDTLPEVIVPDWPEDPALFTSTLQSLHCFDVPAISREDAARTELYAAEKDRQELRKQVGSVQEWLSSLSIKITVEELNAGNLARTAQLLNKTNQMNLATRRLTEPELLAWTGTARRKVWTFRVADRYGDAGLTGILGIEPGDTEATITDFVLSCRVMGRKVEETMLSIAVDHARHLGLARVAARYVPTPRNRPCLQFFTQSGFRQEDSDRFVWSTTAEYPVPACVQVERRFVALNAESS
jgi:FkbH-like protein